MLLGGAADASHFQQITLCIREIKQPDKGPPLQGQLTFEILRNETLNWTDAEFCESIHEQDL